MGPPEAASVMSHGADYEALAHPAAYPEPAAAIEVRQTHISVVFLAGAHVYKIKKPVDLGFVDYHTLERRRHFCEEEVRLNRRLAPEVYLGVVPVTRAGGSIRMEGTGEVVEWAVKMVRLPDEATLRAHLARGGVGVEALDEFADRIARFHAAAESGARIARGASFEAIAGNSRENLDQAGAQVGVTLSRATLDRLRERTEAALTRLGALIADRARRGLPCHTHGDLRLEHVYWFPERPPPHDWIAVDCIEFDERFRHADPIADVAFLAMELALEGRRDLAGSFVDAYLRAAGDEEGRALLPFYRAYRAAVRGKVEGLKLSDPEIAEADRSTARTRARALWLFALSELEEPRHRPGLVLVAGLPGAGKSSLARDLAERAGFALIRSDEVRKGLAGAADREATSGAFGQGPYSAEWDERTYAECLRRAEACLFDGGRVLIDATFRADARRRLFLEAARRWGVNAGLLVCRADPAVIRDRLAGRQGDASDADWAIHAEIARRWEEPGPFTRPAWRTIDTGGTRSQSLARALGAIREFGLLEAAASSVG
jgi:aminoglycoside phosphotransferase family enzyme/predicted kinase